MSWDNYLNFLSMKPKIAKRLNQFENEVQAIRNLNKADDIRISCADWLKTLPKSMKSEAKSIEHRQKGNEVFKLKQNHLASVESYSKAILEAPENSKELPLAYANRAIVLMELEQYLEAEQDCQEALNHGYPEKNVLRIFFRLAECAKMLNDVEKFQKAVKALEDQSKLKNFTKGECEKFLAIQKDLTDLETKEYVTKKEGEPVQLKLPNLIEKCDEKVGRYIVTDRKLKEDNPICSEKAFAFVPVYEAHSKYPPFDCQNCARVNVVPFPCNSCGQAIYCGSICRQNHLWIHRFECSGYEKNLWYQIGIAHLGLRTFLVGFEESLQKLSSKKFDNASEMFLELQNTAEKYHESYKYGQVFRLVTNLDKMSSQDRLHYALTAYMLSVYLEDFTSFFDDIPENFKNLLPNRDEWRMYIIAVVFRHLGQLVCNGHAISEFRTVLPSESWLQEDRSLHVKLGRLYEIVDSLRCFTAIFPRISMFNHSCDPNIRNSFDKDTLTVYAARDIEEGGEIFNCYGPNCRLMPKNERKTALKEQYCFDCNCDKCSSDKSDEDFLIYFRFFCQCGHKLHIFEYLENGQKCEKCKKTFETSWFTYIMQFSNTLDLTIDENRNKVFGTIMTNYETGKRLMCKYNVVKAQMGRTIYVMYQLLTGIDVKIFMELMKITLEMIETEKHRFGIYSPEYILVCLHFIDLLAIKNEFKHTIEIPEEKDFLNNFYKALQIVSHDTRMFFVRYIEKYFKKTELIKC